LRTDSLEPLTLCALAAGDVHFKAPVASIPYWWNPARPRDDSIRALPPKTEVIIVGSGFTGLSAALTLLDRGRGVTVIESGVPGYGASTRNGGQVGSGNQKFRVRKLIALHGEAKATALLREGTRMLDYIEQIITAEGIDCRFRRCGRFRGAMQPAHYEAMARDMEDLKHVSGVESFMVPRAEQGSEIGSDVFYGGSVLPNDASLHPGLYHAGLLERVEARGGVLFGNTGACRIVRTKAGFRVVTDRGPIECGDVLVATNGYTTSAIENLHRRIVSVRSGIIATEPLPKDVIRRLMPKDRVYGNTNRVFYYFRAAPDEHRILWGGRAGRLAGRLAFRHLAKELLSVFPELDETVVTHAWEGRIGYTYDSQPHLGRMADGIHYAVGYCGTGVSRATYFGHKIALQIVGDPDGRTAFDGLPFQAFPVRAAAQLAVPAVEAWYRVQDWMKR
jgi:glycine/D-amino acid oxidase-like deaminating enzyme